MFRKVLIVVLFLVFSLQSVYSSESKIKYSKHAAVKMISEVDSVSAGMSFSIAIELNLDKGWHSYYLNAGDTGLPAKISWDVPSFIHVSEMQFPIPEKILAAGLVSYGYHGKIWFLVDVKIDDNLPETVADTIAFKAKFHWLECRELCLPANASLGLSLPFVKGENTSNRNPLDKKQLQNFSQARLNLPKPIHGSYRFNILEDKIEIILQGPAAQQFEDVYFFVHQKDIVDYNKPQQLAKKQGRLILTIQRDDNRKSIKHISGVLSYQTEKSTKIKQPRQHRAAYYLEKKSSSSSFDTFIVAIALAFLGGLILNLMPCVLPVLSIKILSLIEMSEDGQSRRKTMQHGLIMTLGVVISFVFLAALLIILKAVGLKIGWGFQLQSPLFVVIMISVLFIFAFNLLGAFEIGIGLTRLGNVSHKNTHLNAFLTGVFATLVATPCTAPFMGTALAIALGQPAAMALIIFATLGIGMASPYLILSVFPAWLKFLPKPGQWMETLKQLMAFPLLATIVWLIWLLGRQSGVNAIAAILLLLLFISFGIFLISKGKNHYGWMVVIVVLLATFTVAPLRNLFFGVSSKNEKSTSTSLWQPYSRELISSLEKKQQRYFLDFTADWCLSCKVNESMTFTKDSYAVLKKKNITLIKADWTDYNPEITAALESYGRNSIPLYVYFDGRKRKLLPAIITKGILLKTIQ